jgi:hypothetical protein
MALSKANHLSCIGAPFTLNIVGWKLMMWVEKYYGELYFTCGLEIMMVYRYYILNPK